MRPVCVPGRCPGGAPVMPVGCSVAVREGGHGAGAERQPRLDELREALETQLDALGGELESEREDARESVSARRDTGVQDRGEESFAGSVVAVDRAIIQQHERQRREVQAALARIEDGSYGECVACGEAIGYQRLRVAPAAGRCLRCQERAEQDGGAPA